MKVAKRGKKKPSSLTSLIMIRLDMEDREILEQLAEADSRKLSAYCRKVLREHLAANR